MENERMIINIPEGCNEFVLREGEAANQLENLAPIKTNLSGVIGSPVEYITRRREQADQFNEYHANVVVDREEISIKLTFNEADPYNNGTVYGQLKPHPKFVEFGINSEKGWQPNKLGEFFKRNRAFFPNRDENMKLVSQLKNFTAKVESQIAQQKEQNGSFNDSYSGVVNSNLPEAFKLVIPIFKGTPAEEIEVEIYADINGREVTLSLVSPAAYELLEQKRDEVIDAEITQIRVLCPNIVIIEK